MRLNLNQKLSYKVMILVFVPLAFEVVFMLTLNQLLMQAEDLAARAEKSRVIIATAEHVGALVYDSGNDLMVYMQTRDLQWGNRYSAAANEMRATTKSLKQLVESNPTELSIVLRLEQAERAHLSMLDRIKQAIDSGNTLGAMLLGNRLQQQSTGLGSMATEIKRVVALEEEHKILPEDQARSQQFVRLCLLAGVIVSIVLALSLALIFGQGTTRRLNILMDNTRRLSRKQPLNPSLTGADEISELDRVFRDMAVALEEASRKERAVVDNALDVICSISSDGKFIRVNPATFKSWGYTPEELIGKPFLDLVIKDDVEKTAKAINELTTAKDVGPFENRISRKNGSSMDILWSAHWSESEQAMFCVAHDITDRKEMERLKQEFVAMVSHDLRTPLSSIKGTLELLGKGTYGALSDTAQNRVTNAGRSAERLIRLINDILDIEKMESGSLQLHKEITLMSELINRSVDSVKSVAEQKEIKIETPQNDAELLADGDRLIQVFVNLLSNAIKFSPEGSSIVISLANSDPWIELTVSDQGRGIPVALKDTIFERFKQVHISDSREKGGSGLGLAISKAIVEAHGGSIGVDSEEGKGSSFWIRLPA